MVQLDLCLPGQDQQLQGQPRTRQKRRRDGDPHRSAQHHDHHSRYQQARQEPQMEIAEHQRLQCMPRPGQVRTIDRQIDRHPQQVQRQDAAQIRPTAPAAHGRQEEVPRDQGEDRHSQTIEAVEQHLLDQRRRGLGKSAMQGDDRQCQKDAQRVDGAVAPGLECHGPAFVVQPCQRPKARPVHPQGALSAPCPVTRQRRPARPARRCPS